MHHSHIAIDVWIGRCTCTVPVGNGNVYTAIDARIGRGGLEAGALHVSKPGVMPKKKTSGNRARDTREAVGDSVRPCGEKN